MAAASPRASAIRQASGPTAQAKASAAASGAPLAGDVDRPEPGEGDHTGCRHEPAPQRGRPGARAEPGGDRGRVGKREPEREVPDGEDADGERSAEAESGPQEAEQRGERGEAEREAGRPEGEQRRREPGDHPGERRGCQALWRK